MPRQNRPGPLQSYDLHLFDPDYSAGGLLAKPSRPNKRAHSPSVGNAASPKRRFKEEGISSPRFPKSPLSGSSSSARFAPTHFHALLQGPDSPVKRLDFGSSETSDMTACESEAGGSGTSRRSLKRVTTPRVRRSPRLSACTTKSPSVSPANKQNGSEAQAVANRASATVPLKIPRVVTPPDRQSIHYPGFDVYQDPHVFVANPRCISNTSADTDSSLSDEDFDKENLIPRRKSSKKASTPVTPSDRVWSRAGLLSPSVMSSLRQSIPTSPRPKHVYDHLALATPKGRVQRPATSPAITLVGIPSSKTPFGQDARKQMRRALEEEVDDVDGDDELLL